MSTSPSHPDTLDRLPPPGRSWMNVLWTLVGIVALGAIVVACCVYTAPVVISDWQVRDTARPIQGARVQDGKCSSKIVINICDATLTVETPGGPVSRRVNYVFTGINSGDYRVGAMADPARPDLITTDLGLDRLWNRTITLLLIVGAIGACVVFAIIALFRNRDGATGR